MEETMEKIAQTHYPVHDLLKRRWSPRAFSDKPVEQEKLLSVLEAARWAASSTNAQPWSFLIATKEQPAEFQRMLDCIREGNVRWAQHAPVLMIGVTKRNFDRNDRPNRFAFHDVGMAVATMIFQATALNLYAHQMGGYDAEKAREVYQIPETHDPVAAIALGYLGDPNKLPEDLQERERSPRVRKPLTEFVFSGKWQRVSPLVSHSGNDQG
jgi:nitroreductase